MQTKLIINHQELREAVSEWVRKHHARQIVRWELDGPNRTVPLPLQLTVEVETK